VQKDYRAAAFEGSLPLPPEHIGPQRFPDEARNLFQEVASLGCPFQVRYSAED
jgi:hypothetical protein